MRFVIAILIMFLPPGAGAAADGDARNGQRLFALHCAACHGLEARGDGPLADSMKTAPPDLTVLSGGHQGSLPMRAIAARIANRSGGNSQHAEMPVYGWFFEGPAVTIPADDGTPLETTRAIADLLAWLAVVQD